MDKKEKSNEMTKSYAISRISELLEENTELKQQLSEKEKNLEYKDSVIKQLQAIKRYDIGEMIIENGRLRAKNHTEKIQFAVKVAIEELEKVKEYVNKHKYKIDYGRYIVYRKSLVDEIDNQIEQLKGEK